MAHKPMCVALEKAMGTLVSLLTHARAGIVYQASVASVPQREARLLVLVENSVSKYITPMFI